MQIITSLSTLRDVYFNADNNVIIPQDHKGMTYRNPSSFEQVMGL